MAEWLILLLLVPAIVGPAVLLLGFVGCSFDHGKLASPTPVIQSAVAKTDSIITLTWTYDDPALDHAYFERADLTNLTVGFFDANSSPWDDPGLPRGTRFRYRFKAVHTDGQESDFSAPSEEVNTFQFLVLNANQNASFGNVNGRTIKCEIATADLTAPPFAPVRMWITLGQRAAANENIIFSKAYIGHKAPTGDPWDAVSLTQVFFGGAPSVDIAPGNFRRSDEIAFAWDRTSALILSMFFSGGTGSDQLSARMGGASNTFVKDGDEAATADATGYTSVADPYLTGVIRIEVSD